MPRTTAEERLESLNGALLFDHPFYTILALNLRWMEKTDSDNPTISSDGKFLWWNRNFIDSMNDVGELMFAVMNILTKIALGHHFRRGDRAENKWGAASELAVNQELVDMKVGKKRPEWPVIPQFKGHNAEEIYNQLPDMPAGPKPGGASQVVDAEDADEAEIENEILINQAADAARKDPGKLPAGLRQLIEELLEPKVDWKAVLARFMSIGNRTEETWSRPNKRFLGTGFYLPGVRKEGINHIVVCRDTSGSLFGLEEQRKIASEVAAAFEMGLIDRVTVIDCDAAIQRVAVYNTGDTIDLNCKGGGGTSFAPSMRYIKENCADADAVIYFTDMYCNDFGPQPACPTLWMIFGPKKNYKALAAIPPFGECVHIDSE